MNSRKEINQSINQTRRVDVSIFILSKKDFLDASMMQSIKYICNIYHIGELVVEEIHNGVQLGQNGSYATAEVVETFGNLFNSHLAPLLGLSRADFSIWQLNK